MSYQSSHPLLSRIKCRYATRKDLPSLEWDGELSHFKRLFEEAYQQVERGEAIIWIAELEDDGIIGQLFIHLRGQRQELADGETRAYIYGFRVRTPFRNKGIGTYLLKRAEEDLLRRGYRMVTLNVARDNTDALRLYERLGYYVVAPDPGRWSYMDERGIIRNVHEPAWRMQKHLTGW